MTAHSRSVDTISRLRYRGRPDMTMITSGSLPPRSRTQLSSNLFPRGGLKITVRDKNKPAELHRRAVVIYSSKNRAAAKASLLMAQEAI